jgi:hypothetical protein
MIITDSHVSLTASSTSSRTLDVEESLRAWVGPTRPDFEGDAPTPETSGVRVSLSEAAKRALSNETAAPEMTTLQAIDEAVENDPRTQLIKLIVEILTGQKIASLHPGTWQAAEGDGATAADAAQAPRAGYGIEYDYHATYSESATMTFQGNGVIHTADGRAVAFDMALHLQHHYAEETLVRIREGDAEKIDPLVLNFSGTAAQLTDQKFAFDLDADGQADSISFVRGAGFLTLDRNGDGIVNNGSELFGPRTGNGFSELQAYDDDGNHWIDENDSVYQQLQIWTKDAEGRDSLTSLKESHVGALYLGHVSSPFDIKNAQNELQGQVRSSSLWLTEDGQARTLQQIDLVA